MDEMIDELHELHEEFLKSSEVIFIFRIEEFDLWYRQGIKRRMKHRKTLNRWKSTRSSCLRPRKTSRCREVKVKVRFDGNEFWIQIQKRTASRSYASKWYANAGYECETNGRSIQSATIQERKWWWLWKFWIGPFWCGLASDFALSVYNTKIDIKM